MDKVTLDFCVEKTNELIAAPTCSKEAKAAAQSWLKALGTDLQNDETKKYIAELEADIMPIDNLIGFSKSEEGKTYFGAEAAANIASHAEEIKKAGAKYCDCPACLSVEAILQKKDKILK